MANGSARSRPRLRNAKELPEQQVNELLAQAQLEELRVIGERGERAALDQAWDACRAPYAVCRRRCRLRARADGKQRSSGGGEGLARSDRRNARRGGDAAVWRARLPDPLLPLERAETWLRAKPEDPDLLLACARLCLRAELFGKARSYLEASLARRPNPEASLLLADLLESIDEPARSSAVLREAVTRTAGRRIPLPRTRLRRR